MALVSLLSHDMCHYIVTQNVDSLHRKSGVSVQCLSELHGNIFVERCEVCNTEYVRDKDVGGVGMQVTGNVCEMNGCCGALRDWVLGMCVYVCVCVYECLYVCMYVCVCVCVPYKSLQPHTYTLIQSHTQSYNLVSNTHMYTRTTHTHNTRTHLTQTGTVFSPNLNTHSPSLITGAQT